MSPEHSVTDAAGENRTRLHVALHSSDLNANERIAIARRLGSAGVVVTLGEPAPSEANLFVFNRLTSATFDRVGELVEGHQPCVAIGLGAGYASGDLFHLRRLGVAEIFCGEVNDEMRDALAARLWRLYEVDQLLVSPAVTNNLIGVAPAWRHTLRKVIEVAHYSDASILLTGPTGTGKELLARLIHLLDPRSDKQNLVVLDCTTVVPELSGSEFFGHERGAFTNAMCSRVGAFALADRGTLFLDEIGELPPSLQSELLRVVQDRKYKRVGSNTWQEAAFRLVCATNRDLAAEQRAGKFRSDLYYRLVTHVIHLPALSERRDDVPCLAEHFLKQCRPQMPSPTFDAPVLELLTRRAYPGNVRELRQLVTAMASRHVGSGPITLGDVPDDELDAFAPGANVSPQPNVRHGAAPVPESLPGLTDPGEPADIPCRPTDARFTPLLRSAVRAALADGQPLQAIKRVVGSMAVEEAIQSVDGNVRLAARKLGVTDRALQLRGCASKPPITKPNPAEATICAAETL